jgi:hypothetical protein
VGLSSLQPLHGPSHTVEKGGPNRRSADVQGNNERGFGPQGGYDGHKNVFFLGLDLCTPFISLFYPRSNPRRRAEKISPYAEWTLLQDEPGGANIISLLKRGEPGGKRRGKGIRAFF